MTIEQAVTMVDRMRPNQYDHETKVRWLSKLDGMVWLEVLCTHACNPVKVFRGYDDALPDTPLLVPEPYADDVYNYYLQTQIDKENGEIAKYNQTMALFNSAYKTFADWYNRTHLPLPPRSQFRL